MHCQSFLQAFPDIQHLGIYESLDEGAIKDPQKWDFDLRMRDPGNTHSFGVLSHKSELHQGIMSLSDFYHRINISICSSKVAPRQPPLE